MHFFFCLLDTVIVRFCWPINRAGIALRRIERDIFCVSNRLIGIDKFNCRCIFEHVVWESCPEQPDEWGWAGAISDRLAICFALEMRITSRRNEISYIFHGLIQSKGMSECHTPQSIHFVLKLVGFTSESISMYKYNYKHSMSLVQNIIEKYISRPFCPPMPLLSFPLISTIHFILSHIPML